MQGLIIEHSKAHKKYVAYQHMESVNNAFCWAHVRRYFVERDTSGSNGNKGRAYINELFKIEEKISELSSEEKLKKR